MRRIKRLWYKLIKKKPTDFPMVQYWKTKDAAAAKLTKAKDGHLVMEIEGEKETFPGYPRGHLIVKMGDKFPPFSQLKHQIKNRIFNEAWRRLVATEEFEADIVDTIKERLFGEIADLAKQMEYDMPPPQMMVPPVREIYRAWTKVAPPGTYPLRDYLCLILQDDDAYRFRVQWLVTWFGWFFRWNPVKHFGYALQMLEHAEVVEDMKERQRLLRHVLLVCLKDKKIKELFEAFCKEVDWNKVKLTKADKYHFRGKWFKVDYDVVEY